MHSDRSRMDRLLKTSAPGLDHSATRCSAGICIQLHYNRREMFVAYWALAQRPLLTVSAVHGSSTGPLEPGRTYGHAASDAVHMMVSSSHSSTCMQTQSACSLSLIFHHVTSLENRVRSFLACIRGPTHVYIDSGARTAIHIALLRPDLCRSIMLISPGVFDQE